MKISSKRKTLILSFMVMLVSLISFTMTTFAWFSDSASSLNNIVKVGNLDAKMYWTDNVERGEWHDIEDSQYNAVFTYDNYEPGYTELKYIKIVNNGTLAYKYDLSLLAMGQVGELAEVVDVYSLSDVTRKVSSVSDMNKCGVLKNTLGKSLAY